ncbi:uncharacterized protein G2W53_016268 [Senna tora]|uniref:Uncharacterized protein n=1 Tax=Senna tora TaxID=362788 RepID=A0A834TVP2_9FABA|nr:uncharacterized protein G2W53_016268 [Senna tora]
MGVVAGWKRDGGLEGFVGEKG